VELGFPASVGTTEENPDGKFVMESPEECSPEQCMKFAEECERIARKSGGEDRETLLRMARAWHNYAQERQETKEND